MKKVVIFGAAGHTGKYLTRKMQKAADVELSEHSGWRKRGLCIDRGGQKARLLERGPRGHRPVYGGYDSRRDPGRK